MGKGPPSVAIPQCIDAAYIGAQLVVHHDIPARINGNTGRFKPEIVGVGAAAHRQKDMAADNDGFILIAGDGHRDPLAGVVGGQDSLLECEP